MPKYDLDLLGWEEFEHLVQALIKKVIGVGTITFGSGPDGAREATFTGKAPYPSQEETWQGEWIFQAKFHDVKKRGPKEARDTLLKELRSELEKVTKKYEHKCDNYILVTNVELTSTYEKGARGQPEKLGTHDQIKKIANEYEGSVTNIVVWGGDEVARFLDGYPDIRRTYRHLITPGDVLEELLKGLQQQYALYLPTSSEGTSIQVQLKADFEELFEDYRLFGGRGNVLDDLDKFVTEGSGGYKFIIAEPGYGKTALLINWIKKLQSLRDGICYHFINQRYYDWASEYFTFDNLCQQLAAYHCLRGMLPDKAHQLRVLYPKLLTIPPLEGDRLVIVIDGLDEAFGWEPGPNQFPSELPPGVFVVFSARKVADRGEEEWIDHLRLGGKVEPLRLGGLVRSDIADLLQKAGDKPARLADDPEFVDELFTKTDGDPLYIHFLVEDIQGGKIQITKDLENQPRGMQKYFDEWERQLSQAIGEGASQDLLGYVAVSKGGLTRKDLVEIEPDDSLTGQMFKKAIEHLQRFVPGSEEEGYRFFHPRFKDYWLEKMGESERREFEDALLIYCSRWQEHKSQYALSHYARHLAQAGRKEELYNLLSKEWMQIRYEKGGFTYTGFLGDLNLAWDIFKENELIALTRIQTAHHLVYRHVRNYTDTDLQTLVWLGRLPEALANARLRPAAGERFDGLFSIYQVLEELHRPDLDLYEEVLMNAESITDLEKRREAIVQLAEHFPTIGENAVRLETLNSRLIQDSLQIDNGNRCADALIAISARLAQAKLKSIEDKVIHLAEKAAHDYWFFEYQAKGLARLGLAYYRLDQPDEAFRLWREAESIIEQSNSRDLIELMAVAWLVEIYSEAGLPELAQEGVIRAGKYIREIPQKKNDDWKWWAIDFELNNRDEDLYQFTAASVNAGIPEKARGLIAQIETALQLAESGEYPELENIQNRLRVTLARLVSVVGDYERALSILRVEGQDNKSANEDGFWDKKLFVQLSIERILAESTSGQPYRINPGLEFVWKELLHYTEKIKLENLPRLLQALNQSNWLEQFVTSHWDDIRSMTIRERSLIAAWLGRAQSIKIASDLLDIILIDNEQFTNLEERFSALEEISKGLINLGHYDRATDLAKHITAPNHQLGVWLALIKHCGIANRQVNEVNPFNQQINLALTQIVKKTEELEHDWEKQEYFKALMDVLIQANLFELADQFRPEPGKLPGRLAGYWIMALTNIRQFNKAFELVQEYVSNQTFGFSLELEEWREALSSFITVLVDNKQTEQARNIVRMVEDRILRLWLMPQLIASLQRDGQTNEAIETYQELQHGSQELFEDKRGPHPVVAKVCLALGLDQLGQSGEATKVYNQVANSIKNREIDYFFTPIAWDNLLFAYLQAGRLEEAKAWGDYMVSQAQGFSDDHQRDEVITKIVQSFADIGDMKHATYFIKNIGRSDWQVEAYSLLLECYLEKKNWNEVLNIAREFPHNYYKEGKYERAIMMAAAGLLREDRYEDAESLLTKFKDLSRSREKLNRMLASWLAGKSMFKEAFRRLEGSNLESFMQFLGENTAAFEKVKIGLGLAVIQEAAFVAGWLIPDWYSVYSILSKLESHQAPMPGIHSPAL